MDKILVYAVGGLALLFLVLFAVAIARRRHPSSPQIFKTANACMGIAGLLLILAGFIAKGDMAQIASGFLFLVLATGMEFGPTKKKAD